MPYFSPRHCLFVTVAIAFALLVLHALHTRPFSTSRSPHATSTNSSDPLLRNVHNETLGFEKIYVINLPSRTDHRDAASLAASLTGLRLEFVDGVTEVDRKTLPPGGKEAGLGENHVRNWRAHMNAVRKMIEDNVTSALILEDDADWDIRIKSQLENFAKSSRVLLQPLDGEKNKTLDHSYPRPRSDQTIQNFDIRNHSTVVPTTSPYGDIDRWDLLWLGHCGTRFPQAADENVPIGRAVTYNDETVPEPQHVKIQFGDTALVDEYPPHTRVVSHCKNTICILGYGLSRPGAQRLLYELSLKEITGPTDVMMRDFCDGSNGRPARKCLTVQPQLFQHHRPRGSKGGFSDINPDHEEEFNARAFTRNVRWSTRVNLPVLVEGSTDYIDLFQDGAEADQSLGW